MGGSALPRLQRLACPSFHATVAAPKGHGFAPATESQGGRDRTSASDKGSGFSRWRATRSDKQQEPALWLSYLSRVVGRGSTVRRTDIHSWRREQRPGTGSTVELFRGPPAGAPVRSDAATNKHDVPGCLRAISPAARRVSRGGRRLGSFHDGPYG